MAILELTASIPDTGLGSIQDWPANPACIPTARTTRCNALGLIYLRTTAHRTSNNYVDRRKASVSNGMFAVNFSFGCKRGQLLGSHP
jgi:hypothetical protein